MTSPTKILVVDDEPDLEALLRMRFRREVRQGRYELLFAHDGREALGLFDTQSDIEVVLTDLNMPRMDGLELLARLLEREARFKAIVVSAYGDLPNIRAAMNRGAFDFLVKPLDLDDLSITVENASRALDQQRLAARAREAFGRYLSPPVAAALLEHPDALRLGGEKRRVTMLMSDVRGFTMISERLEPERVVELLNIYLAAMADVITRFDGTIDEFIGDAIFVLFGAPLRQVDDAQRAVRCALAMQEAMHEVNTVLAERGLPALEMGIGIHTGEVVVGNIGSDKRAKYGAVGSHVNLTGRIESFTVGGQILISEATHGFVADAVEIGRELEVAAKGLSAALRLYEVTDSKGAGGVPAPDSVADDSLLPVDRLEPFKYVVLHGKRVGERTGSGRFVRRAARRAVVELDGPVEVLDNLRISVLDPGDGSSSLGELYAKVVEATPRGVSIRYTAVPPALAHVLGPVLGGAAGVSPRATPDP